MSWSQNKLIHTVVNEENIESFFSIFSYFPLKKVASRLLFLTTDDFFGISARNPFDWYYSFWETEKSIGVDFTKKVAY
jgi:hypothetical protein